MGDVPSVDVQARLTPRGGRDDVVLREDGSLAVRVAAPAVDGQANVALCRVVAKALGVAPSRVALIRGARSRSKTLRIEGLARSDVLARLGPGASG